MYKFNPNKLKVIYRQEINKKLLETLNLKDEGYIDLYFNP